MSIKRKNKIFLGFLALLFFSAGLFICKNIFAKSEDVVINEIYATGNNDWIELYNFSNNDIDLSNNYRLYKSVSSLPSLLMRFGNISDGSYPGGTIIKSNEYYLIVRDDAAVGLLEIADAICTKAAFTWEGSGYTIYFGSDAISDNNDPDIIDMVKFGYENNSAIEIQDNKSIGRINEKDSDSSNDFILQNPTPNEENEETEIEPKENICNKEIYLNEIFPFTDEEYVKVHNNGKEDCSLKGWSITDSIGYDPENDELKNKDWNYHRNQFSDNELIEAGGYTYFRGNLYLNDTDDTVKLFNPQKEKVQSVSYENADSHEDYAYFLDGGKWSWDEESEDVSSGNFTAKLDIDEEVYKNVYAYFEISGISKDAKVTWTFGDGHKSYLQKTKHKYEETGKYEASVKYKEGGEYITKNFAVNVENFPHPKVKIVAVNPNPKGSDTDNETITIKNKSKKKINLKGWSIATGWKKLVNHPINEKFIIKAGKEKEITRKFSKFTLNNEKTKIELRYPDGEVAYDMKYKKKDGITEGEIYVKEEGGWVWKNSVSSIKYNVSSINANKNAINDQSTDSSNQNEVSDIGDEDVGKQTVQYKRENILENSIILANIEISNDELQSLQSRTIRDVDGAYYFTPEFHEREHYAVTFLKSIIFSANKKINFLLNLIAI